MLFIDSELQTFNAAKVWLCYKFNERSKHAKDLLSKVCLPLLSVRALDYIVNQKSFLNEDDKCFQVVRKVVRNKKDYVSTTTSRYCAQDEFTLAEVKLQVMFSKTRLL